MNEQQATHLAALLNSLAITPYNKQGEELQELVRIRVDRTYADYSIAWVNDTDTVSPTWMWKALPTIDLLADEAG